MYYKARLKKHPHTRGEERKGKVLYGVDKN
jgi:hypothetical protein